MHFLLDFICKMAITSILKTACKSGPRDWLLPLSPEPHQDSLQAADLHTIPPIVSPDRLNLVPIFVQFQSNSELLPVGGNPVNVFLKLLDCWSLFCKE